MKRKRLILAAVLMAAVAAVVVPNWRPLWLVVAYERIPFGEMHYLRKRAKWIPGADFKLPLQVCIRCLRDNHGECAVTNQTKGHAFLFFDGGIGVVKGELDSDYALQLAGWQCTCDHPSHDTAE